MQVVQVLTTNQNHNNNEIADTQEEIQWLESVEVIPDKQIKDLDSIVNHGQMVTCGDVEIGHVLVSEAITNIEDAGFKTAVKLAENEESDLVTGKYEGTHHALLKGYLILNFWMPVVKDKSFHDINASSIIQLFKLCLSQKVVRYVVW